MHERDVMYYFIFRYSGDSSYDYDVPVGSMGFQMPRKKETDIIIKEMELSEKMQERRNPSSNGKALNGPDLDSKAEYKGYGIWGNTELANGSPGVKLNEHYSEVSSSTIKTTSSTTGTETREELQAKIVSASSATQELDDLMTSLNTFKIKGSPKKEDHGPKNSLDDMLGNLQEDMDKQGIKTTQKGVCSACEKPIVGQVITALGKTWHPEVAKFLKEFK